MILAPDQSSTQFNLRKTTLIFDSNIDLPSDAPKDNAGRVIPAQIVHRTNDIHAAAESAIFHGDSVMMIGARTSATNNFGVDPGRYSQLGSQRIVGIQADTLAPDHQGNITFMVVDYSDSRVRDTAEKLESDLTLVRLSNEIRLNQHREGDGFHTVSVGAGITFSQINQVLKDVYADDKDHDYYVPIDLTTTDIAHAGAVYATGAQGPSRFRISDIAKSITISDGVQLIKLTDPKDIEAHQGLWGMTGGIVAMELRVFKRPKHRFAFFVPLTRSADGGWMEQVSAVLALLKDSTALRLSDGAIKSDWKDGFIDGSEVVSREALELVANTPLPSGNNRIVAKKILDMMATKEKGGIHERSDLGIYITGNSRHGKLDHFLTDDDSPLAKLYEFSDSKERLLHANGMMTIIGSGDGGAGRLEEMRLLRESFADIARQHAKSRAPGQMKPFSESTDINCFIDPEQASMMDPDKLRNAFRKILQPYYIYEKQIVVLAKHAKEFDVEIQMTRYGHLNPQSINPHTRVTIHAPEDCLHGSIFQQIVQRAREQLLATLIELRDMHREVRVEGGEKGKMTSEAYELMTEKERGDVAQLLADANPQWQPHLKGEWAKLVNRIRAEAMTPVEKPSVAHQAVAA